MKVWKMTNDDLALLPNGLLDLLPPDAEAESAAVATMMAGFSSFGYQRVKPPLVEFEDSLLAPGPGQALARNTFRVMDPVSQRMMGVRADATIQIARIAASRLKKAPRPLRLSYAGDVLRVNGTQLRPERQFCQVGCELIGESGAAGDVEIALLAVQAVSALGLENISIDLTVPTLVQHVFNAHKTPEEAQRDIRKELDKRDAEALAGVEDKAAKVMAGMLDCVGPAQSALKALANLSLPKEAAQDVKALQEMYEGLKEALAAYGLSSIAVTIDPLEQRGFEYQTGVSFTLFAKGVRGELGRGGRYNVEFDQDHLETATGFTLYMDTIRRVLGKTAPQKRLCVPENLDWPSVQNFQEDGWQVVRGGGNDCTHQLDGDEVKEM